MCVLRSVPLRSARSRFKVFGGTQARAVAPRLSLVGSPRDDRIVRSGGERSSRAMFLNAAGQSGTGLKGRCHRIVPHIRSAHKAANRRISILRVPLPLTCTLPRCEGRAIGNPRYFHGIPLQVGVFRKRLSTAKKYRVLKADSQSGFAMCRQPPFQSRPLATSPIR